MILQVAKRIANIRFDAELKKNFLTKSSIKKNSRCTFHRNQDSQLYHGSKFAILTMIGLFYVLWESFCA